MATALQLACGWPSNHKRVLTLGDKRQRRVPPSRRFTWLTNGFSKKLEHHEAAISLYVMHYNFCRVHEAHGNMTSAMSLGIVDHVWSLGELIDAALATVPPDLGRRHKKPALSVIDGGKE